MPCCDLKRHWKGVPFRITWLQVRWHISECSGPIRIQIYMGENRPCAAKWAKVRDGHSSAHLTPPSFLSLTASLIEKKKTRDGKGQRNGGGGWILAISTYPSVGINQETELCLSSSFFFFPVSSSERERRNWLPSQCLRSPGCYTILWLWIKPISKEIEGQRHEGEREEQGLWLNWTNLWADKWHKWLQAKGKLASKSSL